jgi:type VI secretion system secreted protein VgrG
MDSKIKVDISIEGTPIAHFSSFTLEQRFNEHHTFQLRFNHDQIENTNRVTLEKSKEFIGKNLTVQFGTGEDSEHQFTGKITRVEIAQSHGFQGDIVISGFSPSILIDRGADLGSYLNKDLKTILQQATADAPQNDLSFNIAPTYTAPIDYLIQYRESDFDFINRLSAEYHEWFYYDGTKLNFGKPAKLEEITLIYGRDLHSIQYGMQISPLSYQKFSYNSTQDQLLSSKPSGASSGSADLSHAISASNQVYSKQYNEPLDVRVNSQKDIDTFVNDEHKAIVSELLSIMGNGDNPRVALGKVVNISTSMRGQVGFEVQDFGKFLVTAVYHQLDGVGHYQNTFEGVSADSEKLLVKNASKPMADMQLATVLDNDDPKKQGRVKVKFKWQCTANDPTEWLRVMSPNAGHGDTGKNRGFLVVPEKGDQVIVDFEEGNIARPVVMGSVYHGNNVDSGGFSNSNIKGMHSRKGSFLIFNDLGHHLTLGTNESNVITIKNGEGTLTAESLETITLKTGKASIVLNKDGTIQINGTQIFLSGKTDGKTGAVVVEGEEVINVSTKNLYNRGKDSASITSSKTITINGLEVDIN